MKIKTKYFEMKLETTGGIRREKIKSIVFIKKRIPIQN